MMVKLGDLIKEYSIRNKNDDNIPVYSVTNTKGFCTEYFNKDVSSKDRTSYKIVPKGYFAYNPSRINVGSVDWQRFEDRVIVSPLYVVFEVSQKLNQQYLFYYLKSDILQTYIKNYAIGSVRDNLKFSILSEFPIPLPSLEEQRKIAETLDKVSDLINKRKQQLEKLDLLVKSKFVEMFGDPVSNSYGWQKNKLGNNCKIITGNTPSRAEIDNYGTYIEWIKSDNINTPYTYITKAQEFLSEKGFKKCRYVDKGSILMTCIAGSINCIGNVAITDRCVAFNQQINAIIPMCDNVFYLYWLFIMSKPYIHSTINMSLKGILSKGQLSEIEFMFPPIELQNQFADFVQQTEKTKTIINQSLEKLETLKKALMQKYFG